MTKKEYWDLFKKTGEIKYYLAYKKEDDNNDKKS